MSISSRRSRRISAREIIGKMNEFLAAHLDGPIHISDLCELTGVSERSVRNACHAVCGMSPKRYITRRRMDAVHEALEHAQPERGIVTRVATDYGFFELGRFAGTYAAIYGERPSDTLRVGGAYDAIGTR